MSKRIDERDIGQRPNTSDINTDEWWTSDSDQVPYDVHGECAAGSAWHRLPAWAPQLARLAIAGETEIVRGELRDMPDKGEYLAAIIIGNQKTAEKILTSLDNVDTEIADIHRQDLLAWGKSPDYILLEMDGVNENAVCTYNLTFKEAEELYEDALTTGLSLKVQFLGGQLHEAELALSERKSQRAKRKRHDGLTI